MTNINLVHLISNSSLKTEVNEFFRYHNEVQFISLAKYVKINTITYYSRLYCIYLYQLNLIKY